MRLSTRLLAVDRNKGEGSNKVSIQPASKRRGSANKVD